MGRIMEKIRRKKVEPKYRKWMVQYREVAKRAAHIRQKLLKQKLGNTLVKTIEGSHYDWVVYSTDVYSTELDLNNPIVLGTLSLRMPDDTTKNLLRSFSKSDFKEINPQ